MKQLEKAVKQGGWKYLIEMADDKRVSKCNNFYVPVPQKLLKCIGLSHQAKIVLLNIVSYMGENNNSFPPIADLETDCGMSHVSIKRYVTELEDFRILKVHRRHNNTYYFLDELKLSGHIMLSEILYEFRKRMKGAYFVSDRAKNKFIRSMIHIEAYSVALNELENVRVTLSENPRAGYTPVAQYKEALNVFVEEVSVELKKAYLKVYDLTHYDDIASINLQRADYSDNKLPY